MEIGKRGGAFRLFELLSLKGIWTHEEMFQARPDVMYEKIAADTMMEPFFRVLK